MLHHLDLEIGRATGALVRVLGLAERRGFTPVRVTASPTGPTAMRVRLSVQSARPTELLEGQLRKLYDVLHVERAP